MVRRCGWSSYNVHLKLTAVFWLLGGIFIYSFTTRREIVKLASCLAFIRKIKHFIHFLSFTADFRTRTSLSITSFFSERAEISPRGQGAAVKPPAAAFFLWVSAGCAAILALRHRIPAACQGQFPLLLCTSTLFQSILPFMTQSNALTVGCILQSDVMSLFGFAVRFFTEKPLIVKCFYICVNLNAWFHLS